MDSESLDHSSTNREGKKNWKNGIGRYRLGLKKYMPGRQVEDCYYTLR